jgi:hypothetical protein
MIKVFRAKAGAKEYLPIYKRILSSGIWVVLGVNKNEMTSEWMIRCARKQWWFSLSESEKIRIAQGRTKL